MTIEDIIELHGLRLSLVYSLSERKWYAKVKEFSVRNEKLIGSISSDFCQEPQDALDDLVEKLRGQVIYVNADQPNEFSLRIPDTLISKSNEAELLQF